jgi:hypothetical protein
MRTQALTIAYAFAFFGAAAPAARAQPAGQPSTPASVQTVVTSWLECDDCTDGELQAVVKLGSSAVPSLTDTLLNGLPKPRRDAHTKHLLNRYRALKEYEKTHPDSPMTQTEQEFVSRYLEKYETSHRTRAARALGRIGGAEAANALDKASALPSLSPEVVAVVKQARASIKP